MSYEVPVTITNKMLGLVSDISHRLGLLSGMEQTRQRLHLRRSNTLKTIQGTLAIEGNTLSLDQVTAVINGKRVLGTIREIQEVNNAFQLYEHLQKFDPYQLSELCRAHRIMMNRIIPAAGKLRTSSVGIMKGVEVVHIAPPAENVPALLKELLKWLHKTTLHPLVAAALFHYEFEFIHPFSDGNGRVGRFWQTLLLTQWNPLFQYFPVESMIAEHQKEYYHALNASDAEGCGTVFVEFMLQIILDAMMQIELPVDLAAAVVSLDERILNAIRADVKVSRSQLAEMFGISAETIKYHLKKLVQSGQLKRIGPAKGGEWHVLE